MNDDSTESREAYAPQPATAIASHLVRADKADEYFKAQTAITDAARKFPGFAKFRRLLRHAPSNVNQFTTEVHRG